ncbi:MAG: hypothetical protein LEGION0398_MBIBDBAK_01309 [Legionellaceae bacterium]
MPTQEKIISVEIDKLKVLKISKDFKNPQFKKTNPDDFESSLREHYIENISNSNFSFIDSVDENTKSIGMIGTLKYIDDNDNKTITVVSFTPTKNIFLKKEGPGDEILLENPQLKNISNGILETLKNKTTNNESVSKSTTDSFWNLIAKKEKNIKIEEKIAKNKKSLSFIDRLKSFWNGIKGIFSFFSRFDTKQPVQEIHSDMIGSANPPTHEINNVSIINTEASLSDRNRSTNLLFAAYPALMKKSESIVNPVSENKIEVDNNIASPTNE